MRSFSVNFWGLFENSNRFSAFVMALEFSGSLLLILLDWPLLLHLLLQAGQYSGFEHYFVCVCVCVCVCVL